MIQIHPKSRLYDGERISSLDPLGGDELFSHLPEMNASADLPALAHATRRLLQTSSEMAAYSFEECLAAMRDIGLLLGSIKRHSMQPVVLVPELEPILLELGRRTDMVPRDTVYHYTEWNPRGRRQRMYTADPQEGFLMDAVRLALPHLGQAVESCQLLSDLGPSEPVFAVTLEALAAEVGFLVRAITAVVEKVSPDFFAVQMRPYFEEVTIGGIDYNGPAAAHIPLFPVDLAVWASDHGACEYKEFLHESAQYTLPQWRTLVGAWEQQPSLLTRVSVALAAAGSGGVPPTLYQAAEALLRVVDTLAVFRGQHFGLATKAYRAGVRLYERGSGGGSISLLRTILEQNVRLARQAHAAHKGVEPWTS